MRSAAVQKAKDRLTSAKARLKDLESSKDYESARRHWYDFLICSNAVFSILEQGSKGANKSEYWYGKKKYERKNDPLLRYIHHARNAEEHNVASVTELDRQKILMVQDGKPVAEIRDVIGNKGTFYSLSDDPSPNITKINEMRVYPDRARLIQVRDSGMNYDPPSEQLGTAIDDNGPIAVARLAVRYIELMIDEATSLMPKN